MFGKFFSIAGAILVFVAIKLLLATKFSFKMAVKLIKKAMNRDGNIPSSQTNRSQTNSDQQQGQGRLVSTNQVQTTEFKVASKIVSIGLVPDVGVINLRIYAGQKVIERDLLIKEPRLRSLMRGRRFSLPTVNNFVDTKLEDIKKESVKLSEELINQVGSLHVKAQPPKVDKVQMKKPQPPAQKPSDMQKQKAEPKEEPKAEQAPPAPETAKPMPELKKPAPTGKVYNPNAVDHIFEGILVRAGVTIVNKPKRAPYETFQAVLQLDNGAELPLNGAELERELTNAKCMVGERIAIRPMGTVPVTLANGTEGKKNLYQVSKIGA